MPERLDHNACIAAPFSVAIDTREQLPYTFTCLSSDARQKFLPLHVPLKRVGLAAGDYSIVGATGRIAIERKSLTDLFGTLGRGRARFVRELEKLAAMEFAAVVVEADWEEIYNDPPERSRLLPKSIHRSVVAWQMRYPHVHWWPCPNRNFAEGTTFRILERWWKDFVAAPRGQSAC